MSPKKPPLLIWLVLQLGLLAAVVLVGGLLDSQLDSSGSAVSCLFGGLVAILPHAYFTSSAYRFTGARAMPHVVRSFYRGERGKFMLTLAGFGLIFISPLPVAPLALFSSYCLFVAVQVWLAARQTNASY